MNPDEYTRMFELEDRYWWFVARRRIALKLLGRHLRPGSEVLLDVGCGTGVVLQELQSVGKPVGLDMSDVALGYCRRRGLTRLVRADATAMPFGPSSCDAIVGLDVFEHIERDDLAFEEAFRRLSPGGILVLSVPAFQSLWGPHDIALMHFRRYTKPMLKERLERAGFQVERLTYSVFILFPAVVVVRFFEKRKRGPAKASLAALPNWLNAFLIGIQSVEGLLISSFNLPWGSSLIAVARKPL
ncbi:MAG TPA: methyltransferase domain-containing protein [Fimbriimonadaceae bacterium]|nr:methyltransferase domain-containing protein [Fimbriimonadaceae bacterium]